jgi:hypothetical protein
MDNCYSTADGNVLLSVYTADCITDDSLRLPFTCKSYDGCSKRVDWCWKKSTVALDFQQAYKQLRRTSNDSNIRGAFLCNECAESLGVEVNFNTIPKAYRELCEILGLKFLGMKKRSRKRSRKRKSPESDKVDSSKWVPVFRYDSRRGTFIKIANC